MTPKEKADKLVDKFSYLHLALIGKPDNIYMKYCALIAIDEILDAIEQIFETFEERKYWQEVKQEIEKL